MKEELEKELIEIVKSINEGKEFAISQAPDVIQDFLILHTFYFFGCVFLFLLFAFGTYFFFTKFLQVYPKPEGEEEGVKAFFLVSSVVNIVGVGISLYQSVIHFGVIIAPKWYVVQYFLN